MLKKTTVTMLLAFGCATPTFALTTQYIYDPSGLAIFKLRYFDVGDGEFMYDEPPNQSTWNLNQALKDGVVSALTYWAEIIKAKPAQLPAIINIGTFNAENAAASSRHFGDGETLLQAALSGREVDELDFGSHAQIILGDFNFDETNRPLSLLPASPDKTDLFGTVFHELAHALGIINSVTALGDNVKTPYFDEGLGLWAQHLRDDNGNPARPNQAIVCSLCTNTYAPDSFDLRKDQGYFTGAHVQEVLAGALPGVPVRILSENGGQIDDNFMGHTELKNSLMSHQIYTNYTTFMEAELAILQDLGYDIDRRNFFGHSVYGSGQQLTNNHGYFLRNSMGTAYIPGQYNTATLGLGLHIYGSHNTVYQQADLLTRGAGGAGVRVDGAGNTLVIQPGSRVYADGLNGRGLMFTYGKDHNLILRGDVQAAGDLGIGASFDFGNGGNGNKNDYRGSYIHESDFQPVPGPLLPELNGALVNNVDLTGRVAGKSAAIYMSKNALVNHINVMRGARIQGDITSDYDQKDALGNQRLTHLSFGYLADDQGRHTKFVDTDFFWRYDDNIRGINNFAVNIAGGQTSLNGTHELYSVQVHPGATLAGNGRYTLHHDGIFTNNGTVAPGNSFGQIVINGDYLQGADGTLLIELDQLGNHDSLSVSGTATLNGTLRLAPVADWYASGTNINIDRSQLLTAGITNGTFSTLGSQLFSPTLLSSSTDLGGNQYQLGITRPNNAYSQYGYSHNATQAGQALDTLAATARSDIQPLYQALDFSSPDGSAVASTLDQLSPQAYSAMLATSLRREQYVADIAAAQNLSANQHRPDSDQWHGYAMPFGTHLRQNQQDTLIGYNASSYGVIFGAEKHVAQYPNWMMGVYGAVSNQSININQDQNASGRSTAFNLGLQARYAPNNTSGPYLLGQAQFGVEDGKLTRHLRVGDYNATNRGNWTALTGTLLASAGYRWAVNETLSLGPTATLSYTRLSYPGNTESGRDASRLQLDSNHFDSLRSRIGASAKLNLPQDNGALLTADLQLTWDRELLNNSYQQNAHFAAYRDQRFNSRNQVVGRDALGLSAGLSYDLDKNRSIGANVASQLLRSGGKSVSGNLSLTWRF